MALLFPLLVVDAQRVSSKVTKENVQIIFVLFFKLQRSSLVTASFMNISFQTNVESLLKRPIVLSIIIDTWFFC